MSIGIDKLAHMNTPALSDILLAHSAAEGTGVIAIGDLPKLLNAGNLKMPDSDETIAEHYRQFCNRNLLINWYFFKPVNQQGLTAYQVRGYTIDMWRTWTATTRVSLSKEGVLVDCTNADADGIYQYFEDGESLLVGKIVTISVLTKEYGLINKSGILTSGSSSIIQTTEFGDIALFHSLAKTPPFFFRISVNAGKAVTVIAAKLEFGSSQTLAHREGSKWVLNEIPDYTTELKKCQRYQAVFILTTWSNFPASGATGITKNGLRVAFTIPANMRRNPTVSFEGEIYADFLKSGKIENALIKSCVWSILDTPVSVRLALDATPTDTVYPVISISTKDSAAKIILDANL